MRQPVSKSVLVIDDEECARELCIKVLKSMALKTLVAETGDRALAILESGQVDVVLADVHTAGLDLLKTIRRDYPGIDLVMMGSLVIRTGVQAHDLAGC